MAKKQLIVAGQETGKTTYLFSEIDRLLYEGFDIILLDSAVDHEEKSLLKKVTAKYDDSVVIDMRDERQIVFSEFSIENYINNFSNYFPFKDIINSHNKIICFDLSYFLEKGHEMYDNYNDLQYYYHYRNMYNRLSQQIIMCLILMEKYGIIKNKIVVMDEIEFPRIDLDFSEYQHNLDIVAAVHPENAFGTFYEIFEKVKFQKFQRRKDR